MGGPVLGGTGHWQRGGQALLPEAAEDKGRRVAQPQRSGRSSRLLAVWGSEAALGLNAGAAPLPCRHWRRLAPQDRPPPVCEVAQVCAHPEAEARAQPAPQGQHSAPGAGGRRCRATACGGAGGGAADGGRATAARQRAARRRMMRCTAGALRGRGCWQRVRQRQIQRTRTLWVHIAAAHRRLDGASGRLVGRNTWQ